jgi:hypothetical protein
VKTKIHQDEFYQGSRFPLSPYSKYEGKLVFKIPESIKPSEVWVKSMPTQEMFQIPDVPLLWPPGELDGRLLPRVRDRGEGCGAAAHQSKGPPSCVCQRVTGCAVRHNVSP